MKMKAVGVAVWVLTTSTSCGRQGINRSASPEPPATAARSTGLSAPVRVEEDMVIYGMPVTVSRLDDAADPPVDQALLAEILQRDPGYLQYFSTADDRARAVTELGLITDAGAVGDTGRVGLSYPGYIVSGGSSPCVFSGPPTEKRSGPVECSTVIIVNAIDGSIARRQEREVVP